MEAIGAHVRGTDVDRLEEALLGLQVAEQDGLGQHRSAGHRLVGSEECVLLVPGLAGGIRHRVLANQLPASLDLGRGEALSLVPRITLDVQQIRLNLPDIHERQSAAHHEDVRICALLEDFGRERHLVEQLLGLRGQLDAEMALQGLDADEVAAHDGGSLFGSDGGCGGGWGAVDEVHDPTERVGIVCQLGPEDFVGTNTAACHHDFVDETMVGPKRLF